jgi:hypothetical protein
MNQVEWTPRPDPMMDEIREIRDQISQEVEGLSTVDMLEYYRQGASEAAELIGKVLMPHPSKPFTEVLVKKELVGE